MLYLLFALLFIGLLTALLSKLAGHKGDDTVIQPSTSCATCTGEDEKCEQTCMMEAAAKGIEYYDDEELDTFSGRPSDQYNEAEAEIFAEILHTMREDEVAGWCRSLTLRGINLPNQLKDEVLMLIEDYR